ncbi:hypothetical protein JNJ66_00030 [Candidatus Saccharibacteria bacterium]|nr:hypothetical protein [Candidatus Saccharibacteria bacterium]
MTNNTHAPVTGRQLGRWLLCVPYVAISAFYVWQVWAVSPDLARVAASISLLTLMLVLSVALRKPLRGFFKVVLWIVGGVFAGATAWVLLGWIDQQVGTTCQSLLGGTAGCLEANLFMVAIYLHLAAWPLVVLAGLAAVWQAWPLVRPLLVKR